MHGDGLQNVIHEVPYTFAWTNFRYIFFYSITWIFFSSKCGNINQLLGSNSDLNDGCVTIWKSWSILQSWHRHGGKLSLNFPHFCVNPKISGKQVIKWYSSLTYMTELPLDQLFQGTYVRLLNASTSFFGFGSSCLLSQ